MELKTPISSTLLTIKKPCPFCCNHNHPELDTGGACCFCDYQGFVTIGGMFSNFSNMEQYNEIYNSSNHQEMINRLHGRL